MLSKVVLIVVFRHVLWVDFPDKNDLTPKVTCCVLGQVLRRSYFITAMACLAADLGHTECLQAFQARQIILDGSVSCCAANAGKLSCLRLAQELGDEWTASCIQQAAYQGTC
jgi:hypothetical protein